MAKRSSLSIRKIIPELRVEMQEGLKNGRETCVCNQVKTDYIKQNENDLRSFTNT